MINIKFTKDISLDQHEALEKTLQTVLTEDNIHAEIINTNTGNEMTTPRDFHCPECGNETDEVIVISECSQTGILKKNTNVVEEYTDLTVGRSLRIVCPECGKKISNHIKA